MSKRQRDAAAGSGTPASSPTISSGSFQPQVRVGSTERARAKELQSTMRLSKEGPVNPDTKDYCGAFAALDLDNSWDLAVFKKGFSISITSMSDELVEFDMVGIDPPLANAFRRILIAEVATVAIGCVTIYQNTSVIHDENLAHRLGLVPIVVEPDLLQWRKEGAEYNEDNSIFFKMQVGCDQDTKSVYSSDLKWKPLSKAQEDKFKDRPPRPVADDILLAKLRSGQEIELECHCENGIGRDHAKWSPVCTATYRLLPQITLSKDILGADAVKLKDVCPMGVFDIEDLPATAGKQAQRRAVVAHPRKCTTCRECITTFEGDKHGLQLEKKKDHYLFSIESVGQIPAPDLFERAVKKLSEKCETAKNIQSTPLL